MGTVFSADSDGATTNQLFWDAYTIAWDSHCTYLASSAPIFAEPCLPVISCFIKRSQGSFSRYPDLEIIKFVSWIVSWIDATDDSVSTWLLAYDPGSGDNIASSTRPREPTITLTGMLIDSAALNVAFGDMAHRDFLSLLAIRSSISVDILTLDLQRSLL